MWSIVHVLSSFGLGGQERVALDLATGQQARGHRVAVISLAPPPDGPVADELARAGVATARVVKRPHGLDLTLAVRLARVLRDHRADIVHTHNPLPLTYGAPAAKLVAAAVIHTKHGANPSGRGNLVLRRAAARMVDAFVAVSRTTADQARAKREVDPRRLYTIDNGIPLARYAPDPVARADVRRELALGDSWVIGTVGRLDRNKNQAMLVRALAPLLSRELRLVIVGEGDARGEIEAAIAQLADPSCVVLTGRRMDVPRVVQAFDVFALSSITEGLPLVIPEAMAAALPVVSTAVGGIPDVLRDGETGVLVPVDEGALRAALADLATHRDRARSLGQRARSDALARFTSERMIDAYLALYASVRSGR